MGGDGLDGGTDNARGDMSERSVHDNNLYAYAILCEQQRIVLHTGYRGRGGDEYTDVTFIGVAAHYFEDVLQGNILFGIDEVEPEKIVNEWADLFARRKKWGWPALEYSDPEDLVSLLKKRGVRGYEIGSSYGLSGWVLATAIDISARAAKL